MKLKDYVTLGNLLAGFASVVALFLGDFTMASYLIFVAYAFDVLDGPVARLTRQHDAFGTHLDAVCDFVTNSIFASFLVFWAFWQHAGWPWPVAAMLGAFPCTFGTLRQARGMDRPLSYPCYWLGLPRPVATLFFVAILNATLVQSSSGTDRTTTYAIVAALIVVLSVLHLSTLPFCNHHERRWMGPLRFGAWWFLAGTPLVWIGAWAVLGEPEWVFDYVAFSLACYIFVSWMQIPREDLRRIRAYVTEGTPSVPLVHRSSTWRPTSLVPFFVAERPDTAPG